MTTQTTIINTSNQQPSFLNQLTEMQTFLTVWIGQVISVVGSSMTGFALGVYVYERTGSATNFAFVLLFNMLPKAVLSPIAGVLADRWKRRMLMIASDSGAAVTTLAIASLLLSGQLEVWHIYLATALNSALNALQVPAYNAAVSTLVPKEQYGRVSGLLQLGDAVGQILAPLLAGLLISVVALEGVIVADMLTFMVAVGTLLTVRFPEIEREASSKSHASIWAEARAGWQYLVERPGLMGLVLVFAAGNFFIGNAEALLTPLVLSITSAETLGLLLSIGGLGMLAGGITMSVWGGGQNRVYTVLVAYTVLGLAVIMVGATSSIAVIAIGLFVAFFAVPLGIGANHAIMLSKVDQAIQGRVFALRMMLNTGAFAISYLTAGPLADHIFEPLMRANGGLANTVGIVLGTGDGRGIGLLFIIMGLSAMTTSIIGLLYPRIRHVEIELPDAQS